jgi:hypothetical protein
MESIIIENIGPKQCRRRLILGVFMLGLTIVFLGIMIIVDMGRLWRIFLLIPFTMSTLGFLQAKEKTCVALAAQGWRNLDHGNERIPNDNLIRQLRHKSRRISLNAFLLAVILAVITIII